eukprot:CAMPEP_0184865782 /NCGR_PEP_ID=MMETSP0580-20130426/19052_1 /TAXON_ID=1118495 /ORGANISM="Dactyliosolen fragilissimus" /LENGTH=192 /DNA_ID=CAMNT_0027365101 /DNA_START=102 /DNA_END=680 /DNA_ORIENTATION=+
MPKQSRARKDYTVSPLLMAVELVAEPEGGEELTAIESMPFCRVKNLGADDEVNSEDGSQVYSFWMTAEADGALIKKYRTQVEKDASKKANFPGFRKGQIPPYAQPQMTMFALQEGIIKTCEGAVSAFGLNSLSGSDGSVEVHEDVQEMAKGYKVGTNVKFTASFKATMDLSQTEPADVDDSSGDIVDAEIVE